MSGKTVVTAFVVALLVIVVLMPSVASAQCQWWQYCPGQQQQPGVSSVSVVMTQERAWGNGQVTITIYLSNNMPYPTDGAAVLSLSPDVIYARGLLINAPSQGTSILPGSRSGNWTFHLGASGQASASFDVGVNVNYLHPGCLLANLSGNAGRSYISGQVFNTTS